MEKYKEDLLRLSTYKMKNYTDYSAPKCIELCKKKCSCTIRLHPRTKHIKLIYRNTQRAISFNLPYNEERQPSSVGHPVYFILESR